MTEKSLCSAILEQLDEATLAAVAHHYKFRTSGSKRNVVRQLASALGDDAQNLLSTRGPFPITWWRTLCSSLGRRTRPDATFSEIRTELANALAELEDEKDHLGGVDIYEDETDDPLDYEEEDEDEDAEYDDIEEAANDEEDFLYDEEDSDEDDAYPDGVSVVKLRWEAAVPLSDLERLPNLERGFYAIFQRKQVGRMCYEQKVLYIGLAFDQSVTKRIKQSHQSYAQLTYHLNVVQQRNIQILVTVSQLVNACGDESRALSEDIENLLISRHKPELNQRGRTYQGRQLVIINTGHFEPLKVRCWSELFATHTVLPG